MKKQILSLAIAAGLAVSGIPAVKPCILSHAETVSSDWTAYSSFLGNGEKAVTMYCYNGNDAEAFIPDSYGSLRTRMLIPQTLIAKGLNPAMLAENKAVFHVPDDVDIYWYERDSANSFSKIPHGFTLELVWDSGKTVRMTNNFDGSDSSSHPASEVWEYTVLDENNIRLDRYLGKGCGTYNPISADHPQLHYETTSDYVRIIFPKEIDGIPVTSIGKNVLGDDMNFAYPLALEIPDSITDFEEGCFDNPSICHLSNDSEISYDVRTHNGERCLYVDSVSGDFARVPSYVAGYPVRGVNSASHNRRELFSIQLPDTVTVIENSAFYDIPKLKNINIPDGVTMIPTRCFKDCPFMKQPENFDHVKYIAKDAFEDCPHAVYPAEKVINNCQPSLDSDSPFIICESENGSCYKIYHHEEKPRAELIYTYDRSADIPSEYMGLPLTSAFSNKMPYGADTIIIDNAETADVDSVLNVIEQNIDFSAYPDIDLILRKERTLASSKNSNSFDYLISKIIDHELIGNISSIKIRSNDVTIPTFGLPLNNNNVYGTSVNELAFPGNVTIKGAAISGSNLKSLRFSGEGAKIIFDKNAIESGIGLEQLICPEECADLSIGESVFEDNLLTELVLPKGTSNIGKSAFKGNKELKTVTINDSPKIGTLAFEGCTSLESVSIKGSPELDSFVFFGCNALKNIDIDLSTDFNDPNGTCFAGCFSLETINGENVFNEDGSPKDKYKDFIERNFTSANNNGIINNYVLYRVHQALSECITDDMTEMEKLKAIHDKICSMTTYDHDDADAQKNHTDVSIFLNDSTVCEGYAKAFNIMLHEAGIQSCLVENRDHAWVIVTLGGHNFHVDVTWDDGDVVDYEWFLKTDNEIKPDSLHSTWDVIKPSKLHEFQTDTTPICGEKMGDVNGDDVVDGKDASEILSSYAKASAGAEPTADTILSDFNFNGKVDAADASAILRYYSENSVSQ